MSDSSLERAGYVSMRAFTSEKQRDSMKERQERAWGHCSPESVLVAGMGNHWCPGAWQRVTDMVMRTNAEGCYCGFQELQDRCLNWGDALGSMRNEGLLVAKNEGFEWLCYVDNDVQPEPDTLLKLLRRNCSVITPYVAEPGLGRPLHGPARQPGTGLWAVKWTVLSMLLIRTNVFNCTGPSFWADAIGADEGIHFQILWYYGHQLYLDSDVPLIVSAPPTYPLASNKLEWADREAYWKERRQRMLGVPDRRPIKPDDPRVDDNGQYMPFHQAKPQAVTTGTAIGALGVAEPITEWGEGEW